MVVSESVSGGPADRRFFTTLYAAGRVSSASFSDFAVRSAVVRSWAGMALTVMVLWYPKYRSKQRLKFANVMYAVMLLFCVALDHTVSHCSPELFVACLWYKELKDSWQGTECVGPCMLPVTKLKVFLTSSDNLASEYGL